MNQVARKLRDRNSITERRFVLPSLNRFDGGGTTILDIYEITYEGLEKPATLYS